MLSQLLIDIKKDMEDDMSVAVLVRTNFDGVIPSLALESAKAFNFSISGENMTLASPLPRKLLGITSLFTERSTPSVKTSLQFFTKKGGEYEIAQLMNVCKTNGLNIWQIPESDLKYSAPHISSFILEIKNIFYQNGKRDKSREIEALRYIYFYMMTKVFVGDNAYCANARAYLESLIYVIDSNNFSTIYEFIEEFDFLNDKMKGRVKKSKTPIHIVTVHEAKGKEWDSVYVWNDSKDVFPSAKCDINDTQQLEEERRVHYIACTRAKKREHIYSLAGQQGMFCQELAATPQSPMNSIVTPLKHS
jgi:DNA helicase-2/ATP-dependent DNA helicase PcrA